MPTTTPQKAIEVVEEWLGIYPPTFNNLFVIVPDKKRYLELSTPLFWYALYSLREQGKILFEEPLVFTISRNQNDYNS